VYVGPPLAGPDGDGPLNTNLYVDTNGDSTYLNFGVGGAYINPDGDQIWFSYQGDPQRTDITAADDALVWAWTGVADTKPQRATISEVDGVSLEGCSDDE
jgi:hypothetical protein